MRSAWVLLIASSTVLLAACAETPRCVDRGTPERPRVAVECNAGKVPVCGNDPARIYDPLGALLPVPPESVANGSCDGIVGSCRPRPVCARGGEPVTCVTSETAYCVLGAVQTTAPPAMPAPPPSMDPGPPASGSADAGSNE